MLLLTLARAEDGGEELVTNMIKIEKIRNMLKDRIFLLDSIAI
jgi:hypothetical protein